MKNESYIGNNEPQCEDRGSKLLDELKGYAGLTKMFAGNSAISADAEKKARNLSLAAEEARSEYSHALSSACDLNAIGKHNRALVIKDLSNKWRENQKISHAVRVMSSMDTSQIMSIINHGAFIGMVNIGRGRGVVFDLNSSVEKGAEHQQILSQLTLMEDDAKKNMRVMEQNMLTDIRIEYMMEIQREKNNENNPSFESKHTDIQMQMK
jgi:hypothetical protein